MRICLPLVLLLPPAASAGSFAGPFSRNARQFSACVIHGKDVDVARFCAATRAYCELLRKFGRFAGPSIANVRMCLAKIETAQQSLVHRITQNERKSLRSMKGLLKAERALEPPIHKPGGVLFDPSAAMGLLWVRRGLHMWAETFEQQVEVLKERIKAAKKGKNGRESTEVRVLSLQFGLKSSKAQLPTLADQCRTAYERTVEKFHGRVSRTAFNVACRATPDWDIVVTRAKLSEVDEGLYADLKAWVVAVKEVVKLLKSIHLQLDLEDTRKSA